MQKRHPPTFYDILKSGSHMKSIKLSQITVVTLLTSIYFSTIYAEGSHDHSHDVHSKAHWASPKEAAQRINPISNDKDSVSRGALIYSKHCISCHGVNAEGNGALAATLNPKPTNLKAMSGGHSDGDFAWKIANGRDAMPAWKDTLSENEIWDLVNFIQNLQNEINNPDIKHDHKNHKH